MAIREDEVEKLYGSRPDAVVVPTGNGMAIDLGDHAGAVAKVRRHVLRRLLIADVAGPGHGRRARPPAGLGRLEQSQLGPGPDRAPSPCSTWP